LPQTTLFTPIFFQLLSERSWSEHVLKQKFKPKYGMPKNALFLLKSRKNPRALVAPPPDPLASGGWGLHPQASATAPP